MNARHFTVLAVVALVAVGAAFYSTSLRDIDTGGAADAGTLVPGLKAAVNDVERIRIATAGDETVVSLVRGENQWRVEQKANYPADTGSIRELLLALADARLRERKTANPDNYGFLDVQDITDPDASGVQVELTGVDSAPVVIGKSAAGGGDGTYVRLAGDSQSWLASGSIEVARSPLEWLNRDIINMPASRIQSITVQHPDGEVLRISRQERSAPTFEVEAVPEGRDLSSPTAAGPMGSVLQGLRLDDVEPADGVTMAEPTTTLYRTFHGLVITVESEAGDDSKARVRLRVTFDEALARSFVPPADEFETVAGQDSQESRDSVSGGADDDAAPEEPSFTAAQEQAAELDSRLSPWVFQIPAYKHQQMTRRMEALLKALPEPETSD